MSLLVKEPLPLRWLQLRFGRGLDQSEVRAFLTSLMADRGLGTVVFEVVIRDGDAVFRVGSSNIGRVQRLIVSFLPHLTAAPTERRLAQTTDATALRTSNRQRPLNCSEPEASTARLLSALTSTPGSVHQLVIADRLSPVAIANRLESIPGQSWPTALVGAALYGKRRVDSEARRAVAQKQGIPGARVNVRSLQTHRGSGAYGAALRALQSPGLQVRLVSGDVGAARRARPGRGAVSLNVDEILVLLGWPYGDRAYPGLDRSGPRPLAPAAVRQDHDRVIGISTFPGSQAELGMSVTDSLRHLHLLGPTGVGKSTLLLNMILQDIAAGRSAVVIDPKGDLVADVLASADQSQLKRLVVLDPAQRGSVVGFNPLAVDARSAELAVDGVLHVMKELYASSWGPRTQDILHAALLSLVGTPWASLIHVGRLLTDPDFRTRVLDSTSRSFHLQSFWDWFEELSSPERAQIVAPALNKLRPFLLRSSLRAMLGQVQPEFDPKTVFSERTVLLVPLRKGEIGAEAAALIGSLVVAQIWQLAQARTAIPAERRRPVMMYLDEFQDYLRLPTDFTDLLAQARGLGVGLNLAHQHLAQLRPDVRAAVLANAQSRVTFRLGAEDANVMARSTDLLEGSDFRALKRYDIYADLLGGGEPSGWTSGRTVLAPKAVRDPTKMANAIAEHYGVSPQEVDRQFETGAEQQSNIEPQNRDGDGLDGIGRHKRGRS